MLDTLGQIDLRAPVYASEATSAGDPTLVGTIDLPLSDSGGGEFIENPEPNVGVLSGLGLLGLAARRYRQR